MLTLSPAGGAEPQRLWPGVRPAWRVCGGGLPARGWKVERPVLCPSPKTIAGIASAVILFVAVVATTFLLLPLLLLLPPPPGASSWRTRSKVRPSVRPAPGKGGSRRTGGQEEVWLAAAGPSGHTPARPSPRKPERRDTCEAWVRGCTCTVRRVPCACTSLRKPAGQAWRSSDMGCAPCANRACPQAQPWWVWER